MSEKNEGFKEFSAHFEPTIGQNICDYVTNVVLLDSRYIFTKRRGSFQFGYCTHCKDEYITEFLKHNSKVECKKCGSSCIAKASGISRKYMQDKAYFVYYEKSIMNPQAIVARGMYVKRDYSGDYTRVETLFSPIVMYVFEIGNSKMYLSSSYKGFGWYEGDPSKSEYNSYATFAIVDCPYDVIEKAVKGTPYEYSTWEQHKDRDMVKFFNLFSKYPCIEYLTKMGFKYFVTAKLYGRVTYGAINWNGKKIDQVLKLTKQQIKEVKDATFEVDPLTIRLLQITRKEKSNMPLQELNQIASTYGAYFEDLKKALKYTTLRRACNYVLKQCRSNKKLRSDLAQTLITWRDYISDCRKLELDLTQDIILFPTDLHEAHQRTLALVKVTASEIFNAKITKRAQSLEKYRFEHAGMIIRPAMSSDELIKEGKVLEHCVARYAEKYANGSTSILLIREADRPEVPFFTMEIQKGLITQTRGKKNCAMTDEVKDFVAAFSAEKLEKKSEKNKVSNAITQSA